MAKEIVFQDYNFKINVPDGYVQVANSEPNSIFEAERNSTHDAFEIVNINVAVPDLTSTSFIESFKAGIKRTCPDAEIERTVSRTLNNNTYFVAVYTSVAKNRTGVGYVTSFDGRLLLFGFFRYRTYDPDLYLDPDVTAMMNSFQFLNPPSYPSQEQEQVSAETIGKLVGAVLGVGIVLFLFAGRRNTN